MGFWGAVFGGVRGGTPQRAPGAPIATNHAASIYNWYGCCHFVHLSHDTHSTRPTCNPCHNLVRPHFFVPSWGRTAPAPGIPQGVPRAYPMGLLGGSPPGVPGRYRRGSRGVPGGGSPGLEGHRWGVPRVGILPRGAPRVTVHGFNEIGCLEQCKWVGGFLGLPEGF
jgi:hypothetical protein